MATLLPHPLVEPNAVDSADRPPKLDTTQQLDPAVDPSTNGLPRGLVYAQDKVVPEGVIRALILPLSSPTSPSRTPHAEAIGPNRLLVLFSKIIKELEFLAGIILAQMGIIGQIWAQWSRSPNWRLQFVFLFQSGDNFTVVKSPTANTLSASLNRGEDGRRATMRCFLPTPMSDSSGDDQSSQDQTIKDVATRLAEAHNTQSPPSTPTKIFFAAQPNSNEAVQQDLESKLLTQHSIAVIRGTLKELGKGATNGQFIVNGSAISLACYFIDLPPGAAGDQGEFSAMADEVLRGFHPDAANADILLVRQDFPRMMTLNEECTIEEVLKNYGHYVLMSQEEGENLGDIWGEDIKKFLHNLPSKDYGKWVAKELLLSPTYTNHLISTANSALIEHSAVNEEVSELNTYKWFLFAQDLLRHE